MKEHATSQNCTSPARLSLLVPVLHWPLSDSYQQQLLIFARLKVVHELILVGKQIQDLPPQLKKESKIRSSQLTSGSLSLMAEAGAFEAEADVLVILKQSINISAQMLQKVPLAVARGYEFGGLIAGRNRWWIGFLKMATVYCKGLCWFRICQGYFVSRKIYHQSGGFKQNGRLISFSELLGKQQKISRFTFLFLSSSKQP